MPDAKVATVTKALAEELRKKQYEMKPVLRMLFRSQHFYDAANRGATIKSPVQLTVQTIRELGVPPRDLSTLNSATDLMGQSLFMPQVNQCSSAPNFRPSQMHLGACR